MKERKQQSSEGKHMGSSEKVITEMPLVRDVGKSYSAADSQVFGNPLVFMETLRSFHSQMGTKLMIPVIGGKELDLHLLFVEVIRRGGFQKVVDEKKWRDISKVFNFTPTTTSASYVLRKHYLSLLHQFEQHYCKRNGSSSTPPTARSPATRVMESSSKPMQVDPRQIETGGSKCTTILGKLDGKFESGYLVSVKIGSEILHGVLYHTLPKFDCDSSDQPRKRVVPMDAQLSKANFSMDGQPHPNGRKRRKRRRHGEPGRPKPNRSAYNFFFSEKHSKLKTQYPNREREYTKLIGEAWNKLSADERLVYQKIGLKDKERYRRELKEYNERLKPSTTKGQQEE